MFLRLTSFLLPFSISLEHGLHEGHALIAPRLLVGLLGLGGLTCCCLEGLTNAVIAMAVQGVVGHEGSAMGLALLAKYLTATLLRDLTSRAPRRLALWAFPFALRFASFFSTMTQLMASRSVSNVRMDSRTIEWLRLYWFCHNIRTDNSTMVAR
jgi:hypothetical protein